jgi:hypothetical protein
MWMVEYFYVRVVGGFCKLGMLKLISVDDFGVGAWKFNAGWLVVKATPRQILLHLHD